MNLHHVELFYHVARHGGISRAIRHIPYGIQQPALSGQILQLEQDLGAKLFDRQPFRLTAEGQELYEFARPFFEQADAVAARLRNRNEPRMRIAASELILRAYLPPVIAAFRREYPGVRFGLSSGTQADFEAGLQDGQIDIAILAMEGRLKPGLKRLRIVSLPLVLLAHAKSPFRNAGELWALDHIGVPLITPPAEEVVTRAFRRGLRDLKVDWPTSMEASSMEVVAEYVAAEYGIGVVVGVPQHLRHPEVRALSLRGFESIEIAALWRPPVSRLHDALRAAIQVRARELWPRSS